MSNKHKHMKADCIHAIEFRQLYQYEGYDQPAEYCPKTYTCELSGWIPSCKRCKDYERKR